MLKIGKKEVHLWLSNDLDVTDTGLLEEYENLLDEDERFRHQRLLRTRHRQRFLVTRALVRSVLGQYELTDAAADLVFAANSHGKPRLAGSSRPQGLHFNVSHTQGLIALAVVLDCEVGIDTENLTRKANFLKLAERYFSPLENRELEQLQREQLGQRFFELWTLKESYIKALGLGLTVPLEEFSFHVEASTISILFSPQRNDDPRRWGFWQLRADADHILSVAVTGNDVAGCRLVCRRGIPLKEFKEVNCPVMRKS